MPVKDFPSIENTFKLLEESTDINSDDKAMKTLATMYLEANAVLDEAANCKVEDMLVSLGALDIFTSALRKRKYSTTEKKPCRWADPDTETNINNLQKYTRESIVTALRNNCNLSTRR